MTLKTKSIYQSSIEFTPDEWNELQSNYPKNSNNKFEIHKQNKSLKIDGIGKKWKVEGQLDSLGAKAILKDQKKKEILAAIVGEECGVHMNYRLLTPAPRFFGQKPHHIRVEKNKMYEHIHAMI